MIFTEEIRHCPQRCRRRAVRHIGGNLLIERPLFLIEQITLKQILILVILLFNDPADTPSCLSEGILLDPREADGKHRPGSLHLPVLFILPYRKPFKQLSTSGILHGKKLLQHTHIQRLAKPSRARDQGYIVLRLPPLFDKIGLVDIEIIVYSDSLKVLSANPNRSRHIQSPSDNLSIKH